MYTVSVVKLTGVPLWRKKKKLRRSHWLYTTCMVIISWYVFRLRTRVAAEKWVIVSVTSRPVAKISSPDFPPNDLSHSRAHVHKVFTVHVIHSTHTYCKYTHTNAYITYVWCIAGEFKSRAIRAHTNTKYTWYFNINYVRTKSRRLFGQRVTLRLRYIRRSLTKYEPLRYYYRYTYLCTIIIIIIIHVRACRTCIIRVIFYSLTSVRFFFFRKTVIIVTIMIITSAAAAVTRDRKREKKKKKLKRKRGDHVLWRLRSFAGVHAAYPLIRAYRKWRVSRSATTLPAGQ